MSSYAFILRAARNHLDHPLLTFLAFITWDCPCLSALCLPLNSKFFERKPFPSFLWFSNTYSYPHPKLVSPRLLFCADISTRPISVHLLAPTFGSCSPSSPSQESPWLPAILPYWTILVDIPQWSLNTAHASVTGLFFKFFSIKPHWVEFCFQLASSPKQTRSAVFLFFWIWDWLFLLTCNIF